jgi:hypothetical protein
MEIEILPTQQRHLAKIQNYLAPVTQVLPQAIAQMCEKWDNEDIKGGDNGKEKSSKKS